MSKRKKLILISIFILVVIITIVVCVIFCLNKDYLELKDSLTYEINSNVTINDLIKNTHNIQITNGSDEINTSSLGSVKGTIKYNTFLKEEEYNVTITIVDTTSPVIEYISELTTKYGEEIDLLESVIVADNSLEEINVFVLGDYDVNTAGTYTLYYVAADSSGNVAKEEFTLVVEDEVKSLMHMKSSYGALDYPEGEKVEVGTTSKGYTIYEIDGVTYVDGLLIVNKTYALPSDYVPTNTYTTIGSTTNNCATCINNTAYSAWLDMQYDASLEGITLKIVSGYRSYSFQSTLYTNYVARDGVSEADTFSARPGHSEHQTGLSFDINSASRYFNGTKEALWIEANCYKYGFIIRYPEGKSDETGYNYESWHVRYVGTDLSYKLYNDGDWITLETYYGLTSSYE